MADDFCQFFDAITHQYLIVIPISAAGKRHHQPPILLLSDPCCSPTYSKPDGIPDSSDNGHQPRPALRSDRFGQFSLQIRPFFRELVSECKSVIIQTDDKPEFCSLISHTGSQIRCQLIKDIRHQTSLTPNRFPYGFKRSFKVTEERILLPSHANNLSKPTSGLLKYESNSYIVHA